MSTADTVLRFWLDEIGPVGWYKGGDDLDQRVRDRFLETWKDGMQGQFGLWLTYPGGVMAYIILMDQFPRNMFRDTARAFSSDQFALAAAKQAIYRGWDMKIDEPARQFFYMPLMHSENLGDQDRCVRLMKERMPQSGDNNLMHAKAHREVIRQFGRFPTRNAALSRTSSDRELIYLQDGGYRKALELVGAA